MMVNLYINLACLSVKTAEPIGPKFFAGHLGTPGKVYEWSKLKKNCVLKFFIFVKFWNARKNIKKSANFLFVFVLYCTTRRCSEINRQLKVKIGDGREAPYNPSFINLKDFFKDKFLWIGKIFWITFFCPVFV